MFIKNMSEIDEYNRS